MVLAALVIAPTLAQSQRTQPGTSMIPPTYPQRGIVAQEPAYFPERFDWQHKKPEEVGMNAGARRTKRCSSRSRPKRQGRKTWRCSCTTASARSRTTRSIGPIKDRGPAQRPDHPPRLHRRRVGRPDARRHHQQRHEDVSDDGRRPGVAARADSRRERLRARLHAAARRSVRGASTTRRSSGITCCGRPATGRARCGASRTGPIVRSATSPTTGRTASCGSRARTSSTTTCAST